MKVVAIVHRSAGNDSVGHMWKETGIFDVDTPVGDIIKWANNDQIRPLVNTLELTVVDTHVGAVFDTADIDDDDIPF